MKLIRISLFSKKLKMKKSWNINPYSLRYVLALFNDYFYQYQTM